MRRKQNNRSDNKFDKWYFSSPVEKFVCSGGISKNCSDIPRSPISNLLRKSNKLAKQLSCVVIFLHNFWSNKKLLTVIKTKNNCMWKDDQNSNNLNRNWFSTCNFHKFNHFENRNAFATSKVENYKLEYWNTNSYS
jgi:hypothetical protein